MKILFYSPVNLRNGGGCERWHCDVTNSLVKQFGHQVEIVTADLGDHKWGSAFLKSQLDGIPYTQVNKFPTPNTLLTLYKKFRQADVVHFIHGFAGQDLLIYLLKIITNKKVLVGHHAPILHKIPFHNWYIQTISRPLLNKFDAQMVLNAKDGKFLKNKWNIRNVHFIPSGIRIEKFLSIPRKIHKNLNFITIGIFRLQKGIDLLLPAIAAFNSRYPNNRAKFRLAGGGELEPLVKTYAKKYKNIINLGYVEYNQLPKVYGQSDIYLLPSREEPFGLVLIEAWSAGLPVLASKTEGPLDMLEERRNGWFIDDLSVDGITVSIGRVYEKWLSKPADLLAFEKECRKTGEKYSIDTTAQRMNKLFKSL